MSSKRRLLKRMGSLLGHIVLGVAIAALLIWLFQDRLLFHPMRALAQTPTQWGLEYRDIRFQASDGMDLHGWLIPSRTVPRREPHTLLFLHGNAGNISHRGSSILLFDALGLDVFIFDYRGFGQSDGSRPSERGIHADADGAWRWLVEREGLTPDQIVIFGRSLGGAAASRLAAVQSEAGSPPAALILESTFADLGEMARHHYPVLAHLVPLRYRFPSAEHVPKVRAPVLVLHSPDDEIIPFDQGRQLFDAAPEPKRFVTLRGGHNDGFLLSQPGYQQALADFLRTLDDPAPGPR